MSYWNDLQILLQSNSHIHLFLNFALLLLVAVASYGVVKFVLRRILKVLAPRLDDISAEVAQDDVLFKRLALIAPVLVVHQFGSALIPELSVGVLRFLQKATVVATLLIGLSLVSRLMSKGNEIYSRYPVSRSRPIKGYLQVAIIVLYGIGFILCIATILDRSPLVFVSGLGAMTAVILLVFRDTLLSLVAGVQLTTNKLIQVGDWVEMPQFGADGDVTDIALHTVKVQNWDKTITTIPTHKFLENSFKNWRGMTESGGRRIKRSVHIDVNSIRFLDDDEISRFASFALLQDYVKKKQAEIDSYNKQRVGSEVLVANARRMTNIGVFRAYLVNYLKQLPQVNQGMTLLVRQLQPVPDGLPIEVYVFSKDVRWAYYEDLQSDIFDHIFAVVREFGLTIYQKPSGMDFKGLLSKPGS